MVCERFTDATYAYQGGGRQLGEAAVALLEELVQGELQPHLTIYIDVEAKTAASRMSGRIGDRFESERTAFFTRVRAAYLARARRQERILVIDGAKAEDEVSAAIAAALRPLLPTGGN